MRPTTNEELERALESLSRAKDRWIDQTPSQRIALLRACMDHTLDAAEDWVRVSCQHKGLEFDSYRAGEEWLGGPATTMRNLRLLIEALKEIRDFGRPQLPEGTVRSRPDGQLKVEVFPRKRLDRALFNGFTAEVWMEPGVDRAELFDTMASAYRQDDQTGKVALVLGAGNISSIGPMDVLYKLFVENQVCILKMNPVNEYVGPSIERAFKPLIDSGYLRVVYGGAEVGDTLVHHDAVDEIHMTGSDRVHDIIAWGKPGEEQETNKKNGTPLIDKRFTSELGCVTPVIVVPGSWSDKELDFQAQNVATMVTHNASFNCNAAKVILTSGAWPQRQEFLDRLSTVLASIPLRKAYYPGSDTKYDSFVEAHPEAERLAAGTMDRIPWTTIFGVDASNTGDIVFNREAWCGILAESPLPGSDARDFLRHAVEFCNEHVWGTLSCSVIVDPRTQKALGSDLEQAIADLRYGSVAINHWPAVSYGLVYTTWGAYPGHTLDDIGSGIGTVHNTLMLEKPQKSVIWGPFTAFPKPPWFTTHKQGHKVGRLLTAFEHRPSIFKLPRLFLAALRG